MSQKPNLKLVVSNTHPVQCAHEGNVDKVRIWGTLTWHSKIQIFILCVLISAFATGIALHLFQISRVGTPLWMLSTFCLILIWALEYRKRMDTDHIKGY